MSSKADTNVKEYLVAARGWETDEIIRSRKSERRAWMVAAFAGLIGIGGMAAVVGLTPLKTVEPFVVRVDKNTGATDIVTRLDEKTIGFNEAIDKYFLARYIDYREEYSNGTAYGNYNAVSLMSSPNVATAYFALINPDNKRAPVNVYKQFGVVEVLVNSISFLDEGQAQVRFTRRELMQGTAPIETRWIATVTYTYLNPAVDEKARLVNPVGFRVTEYRLDPETVSVAPAALAPTRAPTPPATPATAEPAATPVPQETPATTQPSVGATQ